MTKESSESIQIIKNASIASYKGPSDYFTGAVRVDPLLPAENKAHLSSVTVTFEPGARTVWHTHPKGQMLIITFGRGRVQQWGAPVLEVQAGDVVWFPPHIKHWHGSSPNNAMTHIAVTPTEEGKAVDWMEKVSDEQYGE